MSVTLEKDENIITLTAENEPEKRLLAAFDGCYGLRARCHDAAGPYGRELGISEVCITATPSHVPAIAGDEEERGPKA